MHLQHRGAASRLLNFLLLSSSSSSLKHKSFLRCTLCCSAASTSPAPEVFPLPPFALGLLSSSEAACMKGTDKIKLDCTALLKK